MNILIPLFSKETCLIHGVSMADSIMLWEDKHDNGQEL